MQPWDAFWDGGGGVPDAWTLSLMKCIPKFAQANHAKDMCPIALQNAVMKWMSTTILLHLHDVFARKIPSSQKGFMRGRHMLDHGIGATMEWISRPQLIMVVVDFQKAYDSVSFNFRTVAVDYMGLPASYVSVLVSVMSGPIMFCVVRGFEPCVEFRPRSGIKRGGLLSPLLFNVVTIFWIDDFQRIKCDSCIRFYADDILIRVPGCGSAEVEDLRALQCVLNIFGYLSGLRVNCAKTFGVVKCAAPRQHPGEVADITVKPSLRYLGVLLGNVSDQEAYRPAIAKMMALAKTLATLPPRYGREVQPFGVVGGAGCVPYSEGLRALQQSFGAVEFSTARRAQPELLAPYDGPREYA